MRTMNCRVFAPGVMGGGTRHRNPGCRPLCIRSGLTHNGGLGGSFNIAASRWRQGKRCFGVEEDLSDGLACLATLGGRFLLLPADHGYPELTVNAANYNARASATVGRRSQR